MEGTGQEALGGPDDEDGHSEEVHLHQSCRKVGEILRVPHRGLRHHDHQQHAPRPPHPFGYVGHVQAHDQPHYQADQEHDQAGVELGQIPQWYRDAFGDHLPR